MDLTVKISLTFTILLLFYGFSSLYMEIFKQSYNNHVKDIIRQCTSLKFTNIHGHKMIAKNCIINEHNNLVLKMERDAKHNDTSSIISLANIYYNGVNISFSLPRRFQTPMMYFNNENNEQIEINVVKQNILKSINLYRKASVLNDKTALFNIGSLYYEGKYVDPDYEIMFESFNKAIIFGSKKVIEYISEKVDNKIYKNDSHDDNIYNICSKVNIKENTKHINNIGDRYYGIAKYQQALKIYMLNIENDDIYSLHQIADTYYNGIDTDIDHIKAFEYYKKASNLGSGYGAYKIGKMFYYGTGVKQSYGESVYYYSIAVDRGVKRANYELGNMYIHGKGVKKDFLYGRLLVKTSQEL